MSRLRVAAIVEGHGEVASVPILLQRIWNELIQGEYLDLDDDRELPEDPEADRSGKGWIEKRFKAVKYSETVDQPKLTAGLDLRLCRKRSPSFDELCRDLERLR